MLKLSMWLLMGLLLLLVVGCDDEKPPVVDPPVIEPSVAPVVYAPFVVGTSQTLRSPLTIDVRYRLHGCDSSGQPTSVTGAYHPSGAPIEYRFTCDWSVFNAEGRKINGEWVTFKTITNQEGRVEQDAVVNLWVGWVESYPLLPVAPQACGGSPSSLFTYEVRSGNATASYTIRLGGNG
jgi:hypothetical protein